MALVAAFIQLVPGELARGDDVMYDLNLLRDMINGNLDINNFSGALGPVAHGDLSSVTTTMHTAESVDIVDTGGYYTGTEVEAALQEVGADIATINGGGAGGAMSIAAVATSVWSTDAITVAHGQTTAPVIQAMIQYRRTTATAWTSDWFPFESVRPQGTATGGASGEFYINMNSIQSDATNSVFRVAQYHQHFDAGSGEDSFSTWYPFTSTANFTGATIFDDTDTARANCEEYRIKYWIMSEAVD